MTRRAADFTPQHFRLAVADRVATVTLDRPERKNPLTFESYAELRDFFRALAEVDDVKAVVVTGAGENFCSGGDVREIIGPLTEQKMPELLAFTHLTGSLIEEMRRCPQPIIAAIDGICVGAGACIAMASDLRFGTARSKVGFLFVRVGLAGCDMGSCAMLPRIIGQGRASDLLYSGRLMAGPEALDWGFYNRLVEPGEVLAQAAEMARTIAQGPTFAHAMTKTMLHREWSMDVDSAIRLEAEAQAICMDTEDFRRAYRAFLAKEPPVFEGN